MNEPPPPVLNTEQKRQLLRSYFERWRPPVVVETGLYAGQGSCLQFAAEAQLHLIDVAPLNLQEAHRFVDGQACCWLGDSGRWLAYLLDPQRLTIARPALFWLDAHSVSEAAESDSAPLLAELDAILAWPFYTESVVLVDDLRMMGRPGWPSLEQVRQRVRPALAAGAWTLQEADDIMRLTPRRLTTR